MAKLIILLASLATSVVYADDPVPVHPTCQLVEARVRQEYPKDHLKRLAACTGLAVAAEERGLDVPLTIELAWGESRFYTDAVNPRSGCSGILQAAPRWWCPQGKKKGCDLLKAGLDALAAYVSKHPDEETALCHFKSGNICQPLGLKGSKRTMTRVRKLRRRIRLAELRNKGNT